MISVSHPNKIVKACLSLTGSKSITNRLLILKSIYPLIKIKNKSESQDSILLERALNSSSKIKTLVMLAQQCVFLSLITQY